MTLVPDLFRSLTITFSFAGALAAGMRAVPQPYDQIAFERDGREIARMHFGPSLIRPFVYPIIGPSGRRLTRMGHPGDPDTHSHHNSVWVSFSSVSGVDFWSDKGGRIVHRRTEHLEDGDDRALAITEAEWRAPDGRPLLRERRHTVAVALPDGEWMLLLDLELAPAGEPVTLAAKQFGPIGVRVAKEMSVFFGAGKIRNSEGAEGEPAIFRKRARWVDYSDAAEGLTLFDHPSNPSHPSHFHVREDGWMGALVAEEAAVTVTAEHPLKVRYGLYVHRGRPAPDALETRWRGFAAMPLRLPYGPPPNERACLNGEHKRFTVPRTFASAAECREFVRMAR